MGVRPSEEQVLSEVPAALAALLDIPVEEVEPWRDEVSGEDSGADLFVSVEGWTFAVGVIVSATAGLVAAHAEAAALAAKKLRRRATPLLVVPFMSEAGRTVCAAARVSWFDLSGNAHIVAPGIRVIIEGRPDRFRGPGRPASIFAPKSARVVRWLLMHPDQAFTQREIARATDMTEGFVSRIVSRLEHDGYTARVDISGAGHGDGTGDGRPGRPPVRVRDPSLLLDAWREEYRFDKHILLRGHVAARSGDALARFVSDTLESSGIEHAATGLAAAWQMTHFASFRLATFFVAVPPTRELKERLGFREQPRGANLWLVVPSDAGVFHGAESRGGIRCVHPVQAYLDLKEHPERAKEAADRLRAELLDWRRDV